MLLGTCMLSQYLLINFKLLVILCIIQHTLFYIIIITSHCVAKII